MPQTPVKSARPPEGAFQGAPPGLPRPSMPKTSVKSAKPPEGAFRGRPSVSLPGLRERRPSPSMPGVVPSRATQLITIFDAGTGKEIKGETTSETVPVLTISPDRTVLFQGLGVGAPLLHPIPFRIARLKPSEEQLDYRSRHTRPSVAGYVRSYRMARAAKDDIAIEFYRDLILEHDGRQKGEVRIEQADMEDLASQAAQFVREGDRQQAALLLEQVVDWRQASLGMLDRTTLDALSQLGGIYHELKQFDKAAKTVESLIPIYEERHGRTYPLTRDAIRSLGLNYYDAGRYREAIPLLEEVIQASLQTELDFQRNLSPGTAIGPLFGAYVDGGDTEKAEQELAKLRELVQANSESFHSRYLEEGLAGVGQAFLRKQKWPEAERMFREHLNLRQQLNGRSRTLLGAALLGQQQYAEAEKFLLEGYNELKRAFPVGPETRGLNPDELYRYMQQADTVERLLQLYQELDKPDEAAKWQKELDAINKVDSPGPPTP
jgi:hypothetical protein